MEFKYDDGGLAKGGSAVLYLDGKKVGEGRVDATEQKAQICLQGKLLGRFA
jgi:arylsulfatase